MKNKTKFILGATIAATLVTSAAAYAGNGQIFVADVLGGKRYKQVKEETDIKMENDTKKFDDVKLKANKNKDVINLRKLNSFQDSFQMKS